MDIVEVLRDAVEPLIKAMVDHPEKIKVNIQKSEHKTIFIYIVGKTVDVGKLIGRDGRHAAAIRILVSSIGSKHKYRIIVEIDSYENQT